MTSVRQPVRSATVLSCAAAFGFVVDISTEGPAGAGVLIAAVVAAG